MGDKGLHDTGIEWTHVPAGVTAPDHSGYKGATWNPVRGCTKISPGCKHCYAETFAERWRGVLGHPYEQGFDLRLVPEKLDEPLRKMKPHAYFVNSMSDLHQDGVPYEFLRQTYAVMHECSRHLFMVLTKRPENMRVAVVRMFDDRRPVAVPLAPNSVILHRKPESVCVACDRDGNIHLSAPYQGEAPACVLFPQTMPLENTTNIWLGVSVEDRKYGLPRVDVLRTIPAAVRFLSVEPLLEDLGDIDLTGIHWVIVGGESGHGARPFDLAWARRIQAQCKEQGVPHFFKQPGDQTVNTTIAGSGLTQLRKKSSRADLPRDLDVREWPRCAAERTAPSCA